MNPILQFVLLLALVLSGARTAWADGFHSPLLTEKDPRRWAETVRENVGLNRSDTAEEAMQGNPFQKKAAAGKLVDVLRYLDRRNVLLREFPDFNYDNIPQFKSETESLLIALGKDAVPLLLSTLTNDLQGKTGRGGDLKRAEDFMERVVRILIGIGYPALDEIMLRIDDSDPAVRATMLRLLRDIVKEPDFGKNIEKWKAWFTVYRAGEKRDRKAVPALVDALESGDRRIRLGAVIALGEIGSRQAVPAVLAALDRGGSEAFVRQCARALAKIGDHSAAPRLINLLESPNGAIRGEAAIALRFLTRQMKGFEADAPPERRAAAVARWRRWWENR